MRGTGHALLLARSFVGSEPFVVAYPDDLHFGEKPLARQLIETWEKTGCTVLATLHDPPDINRYGVDFHCRRRASRHRTSWKSRRGGASPAARRRSAGSSTPPISWTSSPRSGREHGEGEFFHTPAVLALARRGRVVFRRVEGERLDTGEPGGYLEAIIRYAQSVPALRAELERIMAKGGR